MIQVTNCGYDSSHQKPFDREYPDGLPHYLFLLFKTDAWIIQNGKSVFLQPNTAILFAPNTYIHYGGSHTHFNDDWIHFSFSPDSEDIMHTLKIPFHIPFPTADAHRLSRYIQLITREVFFKSNRSDEVISHLMYAFLSTLADEVQKPISSNITNKQYSAFQKLRTSIYANPALPYHAEELASSLHLSVSRFQHLYRTFFSVTAQNDVIHARIQMAKFYLKNSHTSISSIASICGYENEVHFMRQFKRSEGLTPSEYRRNHTVPHI